jgi:hypothetical protein
MKLEISYSLLYETMEKTNASEIVYFCLRQINIWATDIVIMVNNAFGYVDYVIGVHVLTLLFLITIHQLITLL